MAQRPETRRNSARDKERRYQPRPLTGVPYDRQPDESKEAFEAWVLYRDGQPNATQQSVADHLKKSREMISRWSVMWQWRERLRAWQVEQDRARQEAQLKHVADRVKSHADGAALAIRTLLEPSAELVRRLSTAEGRAELSKMDLWDVYRLSVQASKAVPQLVKAERLSLGLSTDAIDQRDERRRQGERDAAAATDADIERELLGVDQTVDLDREAKPLLDPDPSTEPVL